MDLIRGGATDATDLRAWRWPGSARRIPPQRSPGARRVFSLSATWFLRASRLLRWPLVFPVTRVRAWN